MNSASVFLGLKVSHLCFIFQTSSVSHLATGITDLYFLDFGIQSPNLWCIVVQVTDS